MTKNEIDYLMDNKIIPGINKFTDLLERHGLSAIISIHTPTEENELYCHTAIVCCDNFPDAFKDALTCLIDHNEPIDKWTI